ncbi:MAG: CPBP family intramembrane glutamic endopeptidase [Nocardioidaceae bacterium]
MRPQRGLRGRLVVAALGRLPRPLLDQVPSDVPETHLVRAARRRVVVVTGLGGAGLLARSLTARPGSRRFVVLTLTTAVTWTAGALGSGPLHLGRIEGRDSRLRRPVITPVATGVGAFGVFYLGALVARRIPVLDRAISQVLAFADQGTTKAVVATTCANGVGEELFFRGALYAAAGDHNPVVVSSLAYASVTAATGNPALTLAGAAMGVLFGLQRRASGGVQAPVLTHLSWSILMLCRLPSLFRDHTTDRHRSPQRPFPRMTTEANSRRRKLGVLGNRGVGHQPAHCGRGCATEPTAD